MSLVTCQLRSPNHSKSWCQWRSRIDKSFLELFSTKIVAIYDHLTKKLKHFQLFDSFWSDMFFFLFLLNYSKLFKNVTLLIVDSKKCQKISVLKLQNDVYTLHNTIFWHHSSLSRNTRKYCVAKSSNLANRSTRHKFDAW